MNPIHILVVDDEEATLRSMAAILRDAGHRVTSAENAQGALDILTRAAKKGERFGFLLFDIRMPGMTGPQLVEELERQSIRLPSLAITGHVDPDTASALKAKGCHVLEKPFHGVQLLERIASILEPPQQMPDL